MLLKKAAAEQAYTIVGRIPFLNGKITNEGLEIMVQGDPRLRRPYVVVVEYRGSEGPPRDAAERRAPLFALAGHAAMDYHVRQKESSTTGRSSFRSSCRRTANSRRDGLIAIPA